MTALKALAPRWKLCLDTILKQTAHRSVYKVSANNGPTVLKINRNFGSEGGAVPFLRRLPNGIGGRLLRFSPLRRAVLLERLEGSTLQELSIQGAEAEAEGLLAKVAVSLANAPFKQSTLIPRLNWRLQKRIAKYAPALKDSAQDADFTRIMAAFNSLKASMPSKTVIHGDLYFGNIINTPNGPRLMDSKGYRADPAAEFATAFNPIDANPPVAEFKQLITRRAHVYATAMNADPHRLIKWAAIIRADKSFHKSIRGKYTDRHAPYLGAFLDLAEAQAGARMMHPFNQ